MHSLPRYYGYLAAIFTVLPGLALLILWSLAEPVILKNSTVNTLSTELQALPCLLYTSPSPRDKRQSRMPSSA